MERRDLHLGLVTLCIGGGQGIALLLERDWAGVLATPPELH
jgi:acetyl-CoA acetyltransferase